MNALATPEELKIVFTGPMGAGKTTAIATVSDAPPVSTEVANNDRQAFAKESTTVALDFGQFTLDDGTVVRLYGTPGQERFSFMWEILGRGAMGVILLLDASSSNALEDLEHYTSAFRLISPGQPFVVGVGRIDPHVANPLAAFIERLESIGIFVPVFSVDVRRPEDTQLLVQTVLALLEARIPEASHGNA
jgi:signal recognition particle receptor subunit beta